jgi:tricorn protease
MHANTDANTEQHHALALQVPLDFALKRQRRLNAMPWLQTVRLAPDGKSLIAAARGDLFHIDLDSGKGRNITQTSGIAERHPAIALDGTRLAYFSDKNGGYQLHTASVADGFPTAKLAIEKHPTFYQELQWSPPGRHLAFSDHRLRLWIMDLETGTSQQIDESTDSGQNSYAPAWSPDGRYLAYEKRLKNRLPAIFIFDTVSEQSHPITRGKIYARNPIFDPSGQYLYFVSSPNGAASDYGWSVLNGELQKPNYIGHLKAVILSEQDAPPFLPALRRPNLSIDWEHQARQQKIDWATIEQRILHVPLNHQGLYGIASAGPGRLFLKVREWPATPHFGTHARQALYRFDFRNPTALKKMAHAFRDLSVSKDGGTAIYQSERRWFLLRIEKGDAVHTPLALPSLPLVLTVEDEWRQIFAETSRYLGEHFYAPNYHGHDLDTLKAHYARYLPNLTSRADLTDLLKRMLGHTSVSHLGVGGGDPGQKRERVPRLGLLGADYQIENNRYRFKRIYRLGPYDIPDTTFYAPLDQPGNRVYEGEYLLAINGRPVEATHNLFTYFRNTAGQVIKLKVGPDSLDGPTRTVQVRPLANEHALHIADWAEANRRKVEGLSEGRLDYVHIASFNARGIGRFMQTYLQAGDHQGLIIDQRFNGGGITSDALIELLLRQPLYAYAFRRGDNLPVPVNAFAGAKVLLANQWCASAAETFALMFQLAKIGPIVGQPTMGAGIGPYAFNLRLIDGGGLRVPNRGAFHPDGHWGIENMGVAPDHSIAITPQDWRAGNDPQLAQAIQLALHNTPEGKIKFNRPAYPIHPGSNLVQPANAP